MHGTTLTSAKFVLKRHLNNRIVKHPSQTHHFIALIELSHSQC